MPNLARQIDDAAILEAMRRAGRELRASELAELIGVKAEALAARLADMGHRGLVASRPEPGKRPGIMLWGRRTLDILRDYPPEPARSAR